MVRKPNAGTQPLARLAALGSILLTAFALGRSLAANSTLVVNSAADFHDVNPGDGACETAPGNGVCTLRAAAGGRGDRFVRHGESRPAEQAEESHRSAIHECLQHDVG